MPETPQPSTDWATRDRVATVDAYLDVACKEAIALIRSGEPIRTRITLEAAALRAERILGSAA